MNKICKLFVLFLISQNLFTQPGEWKTYTSKNNVNDIDVKNNEVWVATSGGVFRYELLTSSYSDYTTSNGLRTTEISSIFIDEKLNVWIGSNNGYIHYLKKGKYFSYYNDIYFSTEINKKINSFFQFKDTLYICSDIGLHTLLIEKEQFSDSYIKFGISPQISGRVNSVLILNDTIWVTTQNGIAFANRNHPNLSAPDVWAVYTSLNGLPSNSVTSLIKLKDELYAATYNGLAKLNGNSWQSINQTLGKKIIRANSFNDTLFFITENELWKYFNNELLLVHNSFQSKLKSLKITDNGILVGTEENGVIKYFDNDEFTILPNCPPTNNIIGLAVDATGALWAGTGTINAKGFLRLENNVWYRYDVKEYPVIGSSNYYRVHIGKDNLKWISGWGSGVTLVGADNQIVKVFNTTNGLPSSVPTNPNYVVSSGVVTDKDGKAWIGIFNERRDTVMVAINQDSSLEYYISPIPFICAGITIDHNSTKWFWTERAGGGIFFYNEKDTIKGMQPGTRWGRVNKSNGLNSDNVSVIAVDRDGEIWVGTMDAGINIIYDATNPQNRIAVYSPLRGQKINDIMVDPLNQKWVATSLGVYVLNPDGTTILQQYTFENTGGKLLDNNVISIAMNRDDGTVYFGTQKGLSVLNTYSITPLQNFNELKISPNPFVLSSHSIIFIDGLVENSSIKILDSNGDLVRDLQTPGGKLASWDGCDSKGKKVSSGIYIIVASSIDGGSIGLGKIAVIR